MNKGVRKLSLIMCMLKVMVNNKMKLMIKLFFPLIIIFLVGCVSNSKTKPVLNGAFYAKSSQEREANWKKMIGTWYGSQSTKDGGTYSWIIRRNIQGLYQLEGKLTKQNGKIKTQIEVGEWGVGKNVYFSVFKGWVYGDKVKPSDPTDSYNRDIYQILELSDTKFRYQNIDSGQSYEVEKVSDDFKMPSSDL